MSLMSKFFPRRFVRHSLATHLSGVFAIEPTPLRRAVDEARERIAGTSAAEIRELATAPRADRAPRMDLESIPSAESSLITAERFSAIIPVTGVLIRGDASCARFMGIECTSLDEISHALEHALADDTVAEIVLAVDSPGGTATGIQGVVDLINAGKATKPIRAAITGQCASAAMWLVSGCTEIVAEQSALVGSIGVYSVIEDSSKAAEGEGYTVHVVRSGAHKGVGVPGAPITDAQLAAVQTVVNDLAAVFVDAIAKGRKLSSETATKLATGDIWIASKALELGLIDAIAKPETSGATNNSTIAREGGDTTAKVLAGIQEDQMSKEELSALTERMAAVEARAKAKDAELAALKAKNVELEAETKARAAANAEVTKRQKVKAIDEGVKAGRIVGDMRENSVQPYADAVGDDVAKLEAFIASLPVQVTPAAKGKTPEQKPGGTPASELSDGDRKIAKAFGLTDAQFQAAEDVVSISLDGTALLKDGRRVPLKQVAQQA